MGVSRPKPCAPQALSLQPDHPGRASRAAVTAFVQRYGYRISATGGPPAGACSAVPAWWGPAHWSTVTVRHAVSSARGVELCRQHHVLPATVEYVARAHAGFADRRTGRSCRPTNDRIVQAARCSIRTVQRARAVLSGLELMRLTQPGRSCMTLAQRLAAWRRGSSRRRLAAEWALSTPAGAAGCPQPARSPVERGAPPGVARDGLSSHLEKVVLTGHRPMDEAGRFAPAQPQKHRARPGGLHPDATRLIAGVQARARWLSRTPPRRLTSLCRFARHGWTVRDVIESIETTLTGKGFTLPEKIENPAAYLAWLLRELDPEVPPHVYEQMERDAELDRRRRLDALRSAPDCVHGTPGGDQLTAAGVALCPGCRRGVEA